MPISDCQVRDPRIRRTRQLLQSALKKLMETKSFDEISVQDITEAATVNRATFYDHYTDKFALLEAMVAGGFHRLLEERNVCFDGSCPSAARAIILVACDYLSESRASAPCRPQNAFEPLMDAAITAAIRRVLMEGVGKMQGTATPEMVASATSWAIYGAVKEWYATPNHPPAEEIAATILQLVVPMLTVSAAPVPVAEWMR
jgi:AcrR family transcriptional regulator